ncbi:EAL domain-containing response regulator [Methylomonas montana]|uniref:EAL domain-containing response regulator n=1 Tax=Methylomonas montana TaxID=3058963 RepID=UPI002659C3DA|nr:EAL domain-containing response regulator [Methylomonas montana]WKJ91913.1 EAL domain-containing response regulator [Methylomonas montana]
MHHIHALVLDDDDFMLEVLRGMLFNMGIQRVRTFTEAEVALRDLDMDDPQLVVICDLNMPGMDGVEFIRQLASHHYVGGVVFFSGEDERVLQMVEKLGHAHQLRVLGALRKPVAKQDLANLLLQMAPEGIILNRPLFPLTAGEVLAGLQSNAFFPVFQPQVALGSRQVTGIEALARWRHPQHGLIGPDAFIPVAEAYDLITPLTNFMITQSILEWRRLRDAGLDLRVCVNVSMNCLSRLDFPDWVTNAAAEMDMPLDRLLLEITESCVMGDAITSLDVLSRLCLKRIELSIDDFGTAYSNMEKLNSMPFSELKIDRAFVHNAEQDPTNYAILECSATLGRRLGMRIVAEGVETWQDWQTAARLGCDLAQGYYIARPMPAADLIKWVSQWHQRTPRERQADD